MRDWADDPLLSGHTLVTCLITENVNDLHPMLVTNPRAAKIKIPLPPAQEIARLVEYSQPRYGRALAGWGEANQELPDL